MFGAKRVTLTVEVDLDPIPGAFHTIENAAEHVQRMLDHAVPHYNPKVTPVVLSQLVEPPSNMY